VPFEVFDKRSAAATKSPMATIQRGGSFSLNKAAQELMGSPEAVELLYDLDEKLIGFRPVEPTSPRAFPVRPQGKNASTYMIAGRAFSKYYKLDASQARRYAVKMANGILVLDLNSESVDVTGPRAASGANKESSDDQV
jgi:hypothetical protein